MLVRFTIPSASRRWRTGSGFAVDLEIQKEDGSYCWDLTKSNEVEEMKVLLVWEKPLILMGSSSVRSVFCTADPQ